MRSGVFILILSAFLFPLTTANAAQEAAPILYSRDTISLIRHSLVKPSPMPWQDGKQSTPLPAEALPPLPINIEIRDGEALTRQEGWFNLNAVPEGSGILLLFHEPAIIPIQPSGNYTSLDIAMIDAHGKILQIAPNITLSELRETITPPSPILALLLLRGGSSTEASIAPGDELQSSLFTKPPTVLGVGNTATAAAMPAPSSSPMILQDKTRPKSASRKAVPVGKVKARDIAPTKKSVKNKPKTSDNSAPKKSPLPVLPVLEE